jgi:cytochrome c oxidase subunit 2
MNLLASAQSALDPAGAQAGGISRLWWTFFWVTASIFLLVLIFLLIALARRRIEPSDSSQRHKVDPVREQRMSVVIRAAVAISVLVLFLFLIGEFLTGRKLYALSSSADQIAIKITGHQWWWEVQYQDPTSSNMFNTANEIHIPVGVVVKFDLQSADVIHSFWVPNLHGKKDLVPGHPTSLWLRADKAGTYSGQCAEFCGHQHAHMRFTVIAEDRATYDAWLDAQRKRAAEPSTETEMRGHQVFINSSCILCHTVDGTPARATVGPNLTHIGSRQHIAAGTLPNTADNLSRWIQNPQQIKPGVIMPQHNFSDADLHSLVEYLESLR